ncbi:dihydrodipicolinate synthase family protein [Chromatocurvus halotolerans]|uniref:4-hydroxy-tetrahydrodipicolinate synthase n=1 Tax=Chromatocurvus halotolerans TaxID=1132028 RepID=A0A4V2SBV7_9GAMM|nr:dihydrodipicolinate synthase family protein [Chromatocurvus halotolerans]TCO77000.1 4-hydroxy-tetrahydrodipicolinate synthase [Chromatocurvus halotolerans]
MNRDSVNWHGPMPAVTTPFRDDLSLDEEAFFANVGRLYDAGATGMVAGGCTGEFWALTLPERARLAQWVATASAGRGPAIIGTGAIRAEEVIEQIHAARQAGCDGVLVMPAFFAHLTEGEIIAHYETIDAASVLPIILYNIPGNAGNALTPAIVDRLADLDKVVAVKESSGSWTNFHDTLLRVQDRIRVFCGPSSVYGTAAVLAGADGLIDCFPNVWAPGCLDLWHTTKAGRMEQAWALQHTGIRLTELFTAEGRTLYPSTKAIMDMLGLPGGGLPRPPLRALQGAQLTSLQEGFRSIMADTGSDPTGV